MFNKKLLSVAALGIALAACDSGEDKNMAPMNDYTFQGQFAPDSYEAFKHEAGDRVFFDTDQATLTADAKATLDKMITWLNRYKDKLFTIEGHADERGTAEYNLALGERRAEAVRKYLVKHGIAESRISTVSFGKERPDAMGTEETAWAKNRRAVVVVHAQQ